MQKQVTALYSLIITGVLLLACAPAPISAATQAAPSTLLPSTVTSLEQPTRTGPENEKLLVELPSGFKIDFQAEQNNMRIQEMVPQNESVNDWTTLITVQFFLGMTYTTPEQYQETLTQSWFEACSNSESQPVANGAENGYNFVLWQLFCPLNPTTQKVEYAYLKAILGNDSFYLVQVAFRYEPSPDDVTRWMNYLNVVRVCDSRIPDRACP